MNILIYVIVAIIIYSMVILSFTCLLFAISQFSGVIKALNEGRRDERKELVMAMMRAATMVSTTIEVFADAKNKETLLERDKWQKDVDAIEHLINRGPIKTDEATEIMNGDELDRYMEEMAAATEKDEANHPESIETEV